MKSPEALSGALDDADGSASNALSASCIHVAFVRNEPDGEVAQAGARAGRRDRSPQREAGLLVRLTDKGDVAQLPNHDLAGEDGAGPTVMLKACIFTNSPDEHFIIDRLPETPQVSVAAGFSGHGYKFCSVVGEVMADLAIRGETDHDIGLFRLDRFLATR